MVLDGVARHRSAEMEKLRNMLKVIPNNACGWHHLQSIMPQDASIAPFIPELVDIAEVRYRIKVVLR